MCEQDIVEQEHLRARSHKRARGCPRCTDTQCAKYHQRLPHLNAGANKYRARECRLACGACACTARTCGCADTRTSRAARALRLGACARPGRQHESPPLRLAAATHGACHGAMHAGRVVHIPRHAAAHRWRASVDRAVLLIAQDALAHMDAHEHALGVCSSLCAHRIPIHEPQRRHDRRRAPVGRGPANRVLGRRVLGDS